MRLTPLQILLKNLKGEIPPYMRREFLTKDSAHRALIKVSGENFAIDAIEDWALWVEANKSMKNSALLQLRAFVEDEKMEHIRDSSKAEKIAFQSLAKTQSNGRFPDWFLLGTEPAQLNVEGDTWIVAFYVRSERILKEGEYWKEHTIQGTSQSVKYVAFIDPDTKREMVLISDDSSEQDYIELFKVEVNINENTTKILKTTDLSLVDSSKFDIRTTGWPASFDPEDFYRE